VIRQKSRSWFSKSEWANSVAMDAPFAIDSDDVLAQPTRARLFALLGELKRPTGTVELAERPELHPNGVRIHLERMEQAGLVERARVRDRRGRPPDAWTISANARPGGSDPRAYQDLGRWLARALQARPRGLRGIEETRRQIGRELTPDDTTADSSAFEASLIALGFQPVAQPREDGVTYCLRNCPYRDAVRENQPAICALHKGITRGLLDVLAPKAKLSGFVPHDPDRAGCLIELRGLSTPAK
jgi:predicted ArsR family transcriptional regulator